MSRSLLRSLRSWALLAVALLTIAACGSDDGPSSGATGGTTGSSVLQFTAKTLDGQTVEGTSYAGRPVAFWFWAPT